MNPILHIGLCVEGARPGDTQPVEVEHVQDNDFRILFSPGWVEGIAAGDIVRLIDPTVGSFEVIERGGALSVKFAGPASQNFDAVVETVTSAIAEIGGRLDGKIESAAVWTVPIEAGFSKIELIMNEAAAGVPDAGWWYGNVYDDRGEPLGWWEQ